MFTYVLPLFNDILIALYRPTDLRLPEQNEQGMGQRELSSNWVGGFPYVLAYISHVMGSLECISVAFVRERITSTERPPPVGELSANVC
jgi:hypothetical protein